MNRPYVWQMVKEAVENLGGKATNAQIKNYIHDKYGDVNDSTINCQILTCCVNVPSRINWPENHKPRISNGPYDFLYSTGRGQVVLYDPKKHGNWEIRKNEDNGLVVRQVEELSNEEIYAPLPDPTVLEGDEVPNRNRKSSKSICKIIFKVLFGR